MATYGDLKTVQDESVLAVLRRRGFEAKETGNELQSLYPLEREAGLGGGGDEFENYVRLFGKASFRKMARTLLARQSAAGATGVVAIGELKPQAGNSTLEYLKFLESLRVVEFVDEGVRMTRKVNNIGPSLEWYVGQVCRTGFGVNTAWGVQIEDCSPGGDYDVLAWLPPVLMYVEAKSSSIDAIPDAQIREFLQRSEELTPEISVLLVDTDSGISELIARMNSLMAAPVASVMGDGEPGSALITETDDFPGVYFGWFRTYVINSEPSILTRLRRCVRHYNRHVKGAAAWAMDGMPDFLKAGMPNAQ